MTTARSAYINNGDLEWPGMPIALKMLFHYVMSHGATNRSEAAKMAFFHLVQRHFCDILRCCCLYVITKAINGFLMTQRQVTLKDVCG